MNKENYNKLIETIEVIGKSNLDDYLNIVFKETEDWEHYRLLISKLKDIYPKEKVFELMTDDIYSECPLFKRNYKYHQEEIQIEYFNLYGLDKYNLSEEDYELIQNYDSLYDGLETYYVKRDQIKQIREFENLQEVYETFKDVNFDRNEDLDILKELSHKIDTIEKLEVFCDMVSWSAPRKDCFNNKRNVYILEIFEEKEWEQDEYKYFMEYFYDVDFESSSCMYKDLEEIRIKNEVKAFDENPSLFLCHP